MLQTSLGIAKSFSAVFLGCLALAGCSAKATDFSLDPAQVVAAPVDSPLREAVYVELVRGGKTSQASWTWEFWNHEFRSALIDALAAAGLRARTYHEASYGLTATLVIAEPPKPAGGVSFKATSVIAYRLMDLKSDEILLDEPIGASYTATFSDAFGGVQRIRVAKEGAIKASFRALIEKLIVLQPENS